MPLPPVFHRLLETPEECRAFLEDLMTGKEIQDCSQRILVARMLQEKQVYNAISAATGASTATISRVNRCCAYGTGGYRLVLDMGIRLLFALIL